MIAHRRLKARWIGLSLATAATLVALLLLSERVLPTARAEVPSAEPSFTTPLDFTHPFFPVSPGAVKVFTGREDGRRATIVERHSHQIREFEWRGRTIPCRVVETYRFHSGRLFEERKSWLAQADDGSVYTFGWTEEDEEEPADDGDEDDGEEEEESSGWIVGQKKAADPADIETDADPGLLLPANPERGDDWISVDVPPHFTTTCRAIRLRANVRTASGRHRRCLVVQRTDLTDGDRETRWYAQGVGLVKLKGHHERYRLNASMLRRR